MAVRDINELLPVAQKACRLFLSVCEKEGLPILITETYRSQVRQNELYAQGRTKPGRVLTWTRNSRHTSRLAWDICKNVKGTEYSDTSFFKSCGRIAKRLGITWGGDWKTPDMPHFEVSKEWDCRKYCDACTAYGDCTRCEEGGEEMNSEERIKRLENKLSAVENELIAIEAVTEVLRQTSPKVYHYTVELPEWGRATVQRMLDCGAFAGAAPDDLNLSEDMLRMMVITERLLEKNVK